MTTEDEDEQQWRRDVSHYRLWRATVEGGVILATAQTMSDEGVDRAEIGEHLTLLLSSHRSMVDRLKAALEHWQSNQTE